MTKNMDFKRVQAKDAARNLIINYNNVSILVPPTDFDIAYHLVDNAETLITNLTELDALQIYSAKLDPQTQPWSDDYWPHYRGMTAKRCGDNKYIGLNDFLYNMGLVKAPTTTLKSIWENEDATEVIWNTSSPAEKYDILIGYESVPYAQRESLRKRLGYNEFNMPDGLLTPHQWSEGANYYYRSKFVESWMGLCHGWAAASYVVPRPSRAIELTPANQPDRKIKFYPSDIKALVTLLWSSHTGRVISQDCFDTNPSALHLSLVHQIARQQRSFIMAKSLVGSGIIMFIQTFYGPYQKGLTQQKLITPR